MVEIYTPRYLKAKLTGNKIKITKNEVSKCVNWMEIHQSYTKRNLHLLSSLINYDKNHLNFGLRQVKWRVVRVS